MTLKIMQLSQRLKEDFETLMKAVRPDQWERFSGAHNKEGEGVVDVAPYLAEHVDSHPHFKQMLSEPKEYTGQTSVKGGEASKKLVYNAVREEVPHVSAGFSTHMVKPFHSKASRGTEHHGDIPIFGWATMAAHGLFHAAGMGNNVEDVSVHQHQGMPVTVHRFQPNVMSLNRVNGSDESQHQRSHPNTINPLARGAVLDFLMGNTDRHGENILFDDGGNKGSNSLNPVYIDQERAFQYKNPATKGAGHTVYRHAGDPRDYLDTHLHLTGGPNAYQGVDEYGVRDWWDEHKDAIKNEFYRHLKNIKSPEIRKHIENNFMSRVQHVEEHLGAGIFDPNYGVGVDLIKKPRKSSVSTKKILSQLPADPLQAIDVLDTAMKGKSKAVREKLRSVALGLIPRLNPEQAMAAYQKYSKQDAQLHGFGYEILQHLHDSGKKSGQKMMLDWHKRAMVERGLDPESSVYVHGVGLPPYWAEKFKESEGT